MGMQELKRSDYTERTGEAWMSELDRRESKPASYLCSCVVGPLRVLHNPLLGPWDMLGMLKPSTFIAASVPRKDFLKGLGLETGG